jgi:predicted outer membrane repeat protein
MELIGPATITRTSSANFRIAEVSSTGNLTLTTSVAFTNGSVSGNGGGILNNGAVTLTGSSLSGNKASGNGGGLANADTASGTAPAATFTNSPVTGNTGFSGGGIYNGLRGTLTTTGVSGSPMLISGNSASFFGGGIAAESSTATTITQTAVTVNHAGFNSGGVYRTGGTMTTTSSPISANTPNNCVGSAPAVPTCTG